MTNNLSLQLGVIDLPHPTSGPGATTGSVLEELEAKYHIIQKFAEVHEADILTALETGFRTAFEERLMGLPPRDPYGSACSAITVMMKQWLSTQEVEQQGIPGVPTRRAMLGKSRRFKSGLHGISMKAFKAGATVGMRRPSFIDTGLLESALIAFVTDDSKV